MVQYFLLRRMKKNSQPDFLRLNPTRMKIFQVKGFVSTSFEKENWRKIIWFGNPKELPLLKKISLEWDLRLFFRSFSNSIEIFSNSRQIVMKIRESFPKDFWSIFKTFPKKFQQHFLYRVFRETIIYRCNCRYSNSIYTHV